MASIVGRQVLSAVHADADDVAADAQLAAQLQRGGAGALDSVYHRFAGPLLHLATRLTGSTQAGEDVVHDVFVGLPAAIAGYRETGQFARWLRRIVTRRSIDHLRLSARRNEVDLDVELEDRYATHDDPDPTTRLALDAAITALPDALRTVFVLRAVEGYAHAEIAKLLGIKRGTSEVRFFRAVRALRLTLGERD